MAPGGGSGGGWAHSGGGAAQRSSAGQSNQQVVMTDNANGAAPEKPKRTLLEAISSIQQFYVIESTGQNIPAEFLTISGTLDYMGVGGRSGFKEGLLLILVTPIMQFWFFPFVMKKPDLFTMLLFNSIAYLGLIANTLLCSYLSRFYVGNITRRAINSLLMGRSMALVIKGSIVWICYYIIVQVSKPHWVWALVGDWGEWGEKIYYWFFLIKPRIMPAANQSCGTMVFGALAPYMVVWFADYYKRRKLASNRSRVMSQPFK